MEMMRPVAHSVFGALLLLTTLSSAATQAPEAVLVPGGVESPKFIVSAATQQSPNGAADMVGIATYFEHDYHVAHLAATTPLRIVITSKSGLIEHCTVRPHRQGIVVKITPDGRASFVVPSPAGRPYYLMVEVGGEDEELLVLVDAPIPVPTVPGATHVDIIRDFHADPTGRKDATTAIQQALDVAKTHPVLVLVPPGEYTTSNTLLLHSHTTLYVQAGAVIRSTSNRTLIPRSSSGCNGNLVSLLSLESGAVSVSILGLGRLDANGFALMAPDTTGRCSVAKGWLHRRRLLDSAHEKHHDKAHSDVSIQGVVLADATTWSLAIEDVDRMSVFAVKVLNHRNATTAKIENDGLDLVSVRDASVSHCFVITVDDAMCAKASSTESRNNTFSDNVVYTSCAGNKAGFQAEAPFSDVRFLRTDVLHARRGVVVQSTEGSNPMKGILFDDIRVESLEQTAGQSIVPVDITAVSGSVEGVTVNNCTFPTAPAGSKHGAYGEITAAPPRRRRRRKSPAAVNVTGVEFANVRFGGVCATSASHFVTTEGVTGLVFRCP